MMATKKLSDNSLDFVSGGDYNESAWDSRFLNVLLAGKPGQCDRYASSRICCEKHAHQIQRAWAAAGVTAFINHDAPNYYLGGGKWLTQDEAMEFAMNFVGKHLEKSDWDYGWDMDI